MTPLQLGAMVSAIANGGTLYYLQHPTTPEEITNFQPRIKRNWTSLRRFRRFLWAWRSGAVWTARRLGLNFNEEEILGKTGTCSHAGTRFGWFASYANTSSGRVVVVVFLQADGLPLGPRRLRLQATCTVISTITISSWPLLPAADTAVMR